MTFQLISSTSDEIVTESVSTEQNVADVTYKAGSSFSNGEEFTSSIITTVRDRSVENWTSPADVIPLLKLQEAQKERAKTKGGNFYQLTI